MKDQQTEDFDIRSEEVHEILTEVPKWVVRRGILVVLLIIVGFIIASYVFKYPDLLLARITILSENPPIPIVAKTSGKIDRLFVKDNQEIAEGELIAIIENPANHEHIYELKNKVNVIDDSLFDPDINKYPSFRRDYELGIVHSYYAQFVTAWGDYSRFLKFDHQGQKMRALRRQIEDYRRYVTSISNQIAVLAEDLKLSKKQFARDSLLHSSETIADLEFERSSSQYLKQEYMYKSAVSELTSTQIQISQMDEQLLEIDLQRSQQLSQLFGRHRESYENLKAQILAWEQVYAMKAPVNGKISFASVFSVNQNVTSGSTVFTVVPVGNVEIVGRLLLPINGSGKVEVGQNVNIKLDNYPYVEYGMLAGRIQNISLVPTISEEGAFYTAIVQLPNGLLTNYKRDLPFNQEMQGTAEVITKDRRLFERFFDPIMAVFRKDNMLQMQSERY